MECLKCGKKTKDEQVFCPRCLESMEAYPVKSDIHIQLPNRPTAEATKKRRTPSPEEQIAALQRRSRRLTGLSILLAVALCLVLVALVQLILHPEVVELGKNYTFLPDFN